MSRERSPLTRVLHERMNITRCTALAAAGLTLPLLAPGTAALLNWAIERRLPSRLRLGSE